MGIDQLLRSVQGDILPEEAEIELLKKHLSFKRVAKKEQLLAKGQLSKALFFVLEGCLHTFYTTDKGEEFTRCIALENSFCWSIPGFLRQTPATETIEALTEAKVFVISHSSFRELCDQSRWFRLSYQAALEELCILYVERVESLLTLNAGERYKTLLEQNPGIVRQLPNKTVASYLGITQESLSRIKAAR
jgi:CRP-like cAMP-binding protein